jgi:selenocysteine lyase/cysteine desulfurase
MPGTKRIRLVAVTGASNVLGMHTDLSAISSIVHRHGAQLLVDAAQVAAHRRIDMHETGIDYLAFSGHKAYAPFGSGMLISRKGLLNFNAPEIEKLQHSGTENAAGIAALGKALLLLRRIGLEIIREDEYALTKQLVSGLRQIPGIKIFGTPEENTPEFSSKGGVIAFTVQGIMADQVAKRLAESGAIGVRAGCHCAHILIKNLLKVPPFLQRVQKLIVTLFPKVELPGVMRVSLGIENTPSDIAVFLQVLGGIARKQKLPAPNHKNYKRSMEEFCRIRAEKTMGLSK